MVVVVQHELPDGQMVYSLYGHLADYKVSVGQVIQKGAVIGTVYDDGYNSHLHWEIRTFGNASEHLFQDENHSGYEHCRPRGGYAGVGYTFPESPAEWGYLDPDEFVKNHRQLEKPTPTPAPTPTPPVSSGFIDMRMITSSSGDCSPVQFSVYISITLGMVTSIIIEENTEAGFKEIPVNLVAGEEGRATEVPLFTVSPGEAVDVTIRILGTLSPSLQLRNLVIWPLRFHNVCPGGDHPDENFSARSGAGERIPADWPSGVRWPPRIAILPAGFFWDTEHLVSLLGEPADLISPDFDPIATAARYPVLLIPSGGLYGGAGYPIVASVTVATFYADGVPVLSLVIIHWSLYPPVCPSVAA